MRQTSLSDEAFEELIALLYRTPFSELETMPHLIEVANLEAQKRGKRSWVGARRELRTV